MSVRISSSPEWKIYESKDNPLNQYSRMITKVGIALIATIIVVTIIGLVGMHQAHADTITTDQSNYKYGDNIIFSGTYNDTARITIINPNGDLIYTSQIKPDHDLFSKNILISGPLWTENGTYTINLLLKKSTASASFGVNAPEEAVSTIPSFGFSSATNPTLSFQESNATQVPTFGESNATDPVTVTDVHNAKKIPSWVKSIFIAYGEDQITEDELVNAIKFLISANVIVLN